MNASRRSTGLRTLLVLVLSASLFGATPAGVSAATAPIHFEKHSTLDLPGTATVRDIVNADMTGDWSGSLVAIAAGTNRIVIYQIEDGALQTPSQFPTVSEPLCMDVWDIDGDGKQDVLTGEGDGYVRVYFGKGDGTIDAGRPPFQYSLGGAANDPAEVKVVRMGTGPVADIVVSIPVQNQARAILLGGTPGGVINSTGFLPLGATGARGVAVGTFAGNDFYEDIAITQSTSTGVALYMGQPGGTYVYVNTLGTGTGPWDILEGFIDNNQLPQDMIVSNPADGTIGTILSGSWSDNWKSTTYSVGFEWEPRDMAWGVWDTADRTDIAVLSEVKDRVAFFSNKDGALTRSDYTLSTAANATEICGFQLNNDYRSELAVGAGDKIDIYANLSEPLFTRWAGDTRYGTAVEVSKAMGFLSDTVVIATGENFPDALAGGPLASMAGRLLLTKRDGLPYVVSQEVKRLGATKAYILGGTAAVSANVEKDLRSAGITKIVRLAGSDRYGTAAAVAREMEKLDPATDITKAFVATGLNFPDALAAGPFGGRWQTPILLTRQGELPSATSSALTDLGITKTYVLGGAAVVDANVVGKLPSPTRLAGTDRYATARAIAEWGEANGARMDLLVVATGENFPDALSVSGLLGLSPYPLLLSKGTSLPSAIRQYTSDHQWDTSEVIFVGGADVLSDDVYEQILGSY